MNEEDWVVIEEEDFSDLDFKGEENVVFTVYEVYKGWFRRSIRSKRKIDKDFLYFFNVKKIRKMVIEKRDENFLEEIVFLELEERRV